MFAIDYRGCNLNFNKIIIFLLNKRYLKGYGDSTGYPTEKGVVNDVLSLYELILTHQPDARVFLYGHSLGTG